MVREIAKRAGVPPDEVLVSEIGKILEGAVRNTNSASVSSIKSNAKDAQFSMQPSDLYTPVSGRKGVNITKGGFIAYYLRNRYPDNLWALISARRKASLASKLAARGLAKRSWIDLGKKLGLNIDAPGYAASAIASTGKLYPEDTRVSFKREAGKLSISIENSQPTVVKIGGARALQRAIEGRVKLFMRNIALGTFQDIKKIAARYPGVKIIQ